MKALPCHEPGPDLAQELRGHAAAGLDIACGRNIGLIGYGAIPAVLPPILLAMGASVCYWTREPKAAAAAQWKPLKELLADSDIVSLHVPLTPETQDLVDAAALSGMKPGAILVNTARGGLVDEAALVRAPGSGRLGAAGLDVFAIEPLPAQSPLGRMPNVVLAPHVAWLTRETWRRSVAVAVDNCRRLAAGTGLLYRVG